MEKQIKKVAELAKKYGYSDINPKDFRKYVGKDEDGIKTLRVFADLEDPFNNTWVQIWDEGPMLGVSWYYWSGPSGNDSLEYWAREESWTDMINYDL